MSTISDEIVARVQAAVPDDQVEDGIVPASPSPDGHVVVFCSDGSENRTAVSGVPDETAVEITIHSFGPTRNAAQWRSTKVVRNLMATQIPATNDWQAFWLTDHYRRPVDPDTDVPGRPTVMIVDQLRGQTTKSI